MSGIGGFSGVIPTLWTSIINLDKHTQRSIIQNFNLLILSITFSYYLATGMVQFNIMPFFAVVIVAMLMPTLGGIRFHEGLSEQHFKRWIAGLLGFSGIAMTISALSKLF